MTDHIVEATRDGFGEALLELAKADNRIVGLCADLTDSTRMTAFAKQFPHRFWNVGIAEQK
jgi:transketolase